MGTPHSISENDQKWQNVALIPYTSGIRLKNPEMKAENIRKLTESAIRFDQADVICPILTISEKQETKIKRHWTKASERVLLVDKQFAEIGSLGEISVEIDASHKNLCNITEDPSVLSFIDTQLGLARSRIMKGSPVCKFMIKIRASSNQIGVGGWTELDWNEPQLYKGTYDTGESSSNPTSGRGPFTLSATAGSSDPGFETIPMASEIKSAPNVPILPCYSIPVGRNRDFYGRDDVFEMLHNAFFSAQDSLHDYKNQARTFALCGPGGIGKTQIATEFVHRCKEANDFDAIFWIFADKQSKIADGLGRISLRLGLIEDGSIDARDQVITGNLAKGWLSNPIKKSDLNGPDLEKQASWLLVFDNVDDTSAFDGFWPFDGPGCILLTSRDPLAKESTMLAQTGVDLGPFNPQEAGQMIEDLTKQKGDSRDIGERLGGFPLAIVQMASMIIKNHLTFSDFIESWDEKGTHDEFFNSGEERIHGDTYGKKLSTVWAIEDLQHGRALLDVMAFLDPDSGHSIESIPFVEAALSTAALVRSSELEVVKPEMHRIIKQFDFVIAEAHHNLGCIGSETNNPKLTLEHFKKFNVMMVAEIDEDLQKEDQRLAISWNELGNAYMMNSMWQKGELCFRQCLVTAKCLKHFDPAGFSFPYVNLGLAYWLTNRLEEAADMMLEGLHYREAAFGADDNQSFM
ncbi:MAG: hypothetical protein Q9165_003838 [Trypethelium subeluteriae]